MIQRYRLLLRQPEIWTVIASLLRNSGYMLIMPIVLRTVEPSQLGLWYILLALAGFSGLADLGFSQTIGRFASSIVNGQAWFSKYGVANADSPGAALIKLRAFVNAAKKIHLCVAAATVVILLVLSKYTYFSQREGEAYNREMVVTFIVFLLMTGYAAYSRWLSAILTGMQEVTYVAKQTIWGTIAYLVVTAVSLYMGGGILALALGQAIQPLVTNYLLQKRMAVILAQYPENTKGESAKIFGIMWPNSWRIGLVMLGAFLINNSNTLIASRFLTLEETARYGLTLQLINVLVSISYMLIQSRMPQITSLRLVGDLTAIKNVFSRQMVLAVSLYVVGVTVIAVFGKHILINIGSKTELLSAGALIYMIIYRLLEFHHGAFSMLVVSENKVPFVIPALVSGLAIVALSYLLAPQLGVWGLMLSVSVVQASFNNWWPVVLGLRSIESKFVDFWISGFRSLKNLVT